VFSFVTPKSYIDDVNAKVPFKNKVCTSHNANKVTQFKVFLLTRLKEANGQYKAFN
jgi:hypothetical protein